MKIHCKQSGAIYHTNGLFNKLSLEGTHPIFHCSLSTLLAIYENNNTGWFSGKMIAEEKKLLFLAIAGATGLVIYRNPVHFYAVKMGLVENNIEKLVDLITWISELMVPSVRFPKYVISEEYQNCDLKNIGIWIHSLQEKRDEFHRGVRYENEKRRMRQVEEKISQVRGRVRAGFQRVHGGGKFASMLADWTIHMLDESPDFDGDDPIEIIAKVLVPSTIPNGRGTWQFKKKTTSIRDFYHSLFLMDEAEFLRQEKHLLEEFQETLIMQLPMSSITACTVTEYIAEKMKSNEQTMKYEMVFSEEMELQILEAVDQGPPKREDFKTQFEFIVAKNNYYLGVRMKEEAAK